MKLLPVKMCYYNPNFMSHTYDYDDEFGVYIRRDEKVLYEDNQYGQNIRDYLRRQMYEASRVFADEKSTQNVNSIENVGIPNFRVLQNGSYRGASLRNHPEYVELLSKSGVETVIDLHGYLSLEKACSENNLRYVNINMNEKFWTNPMCKTDEELLSEKCEFLNHLGLTKKEYNEAINKYKKDISNERRVFIDNLAEAFKIMNSGKYYIGCELGDYRTTNFLALDYYFNPKGDNAPVNPEPYITEKCKIIYENMTNRDKKALGITQRIEEKVRKRLGY